MDRSERNESLSGTNEETIQIIHNRNEKLIDELRKIYRSRVEKENHDYESLINECYCNVRNSRGIKTD
jgi:hypothetical protein